MPNLQKIYNQAFTELHQEPDRKLLTQLLSAYQEPHRHYHTLQHLQQLFTALENFQPHDRPSLTLAIFFHDAIYNPRSHDNEAQSAQWATESLTRLNLPIPTIDRITHLIHTTKTHIPAPNDPDNQLLLDLDLSILSAPPTQYQAYALAIRQEYHWVSETDYRKGRSLILQTFLNRDRIYHHPKMQPQESQARINLNQEIQNLLDY